MQNLNLAKLLKSLLLLGLLAFLSACSVKGSIEDLTETITIQHYGEQTGLAAGSAQNQKDASGYSVSSSVGDYAAGMRQTDAASGYTVMTSVQGSISTETTETIYQ